MNPLLWITTLGEFTILAGDETVPGFASRKAEALLVYLAVERDNAHRRESLFTLLWPGMPESSARNNLRQVLFNIRHTLEEDITSPVLLADRQMVQINPDVSVEIDIHQFDRLLESTQVHDHLNLAGCETCLHALQEAVKLYQGEFLADFYLEDSNPFEDWSQSIREAYRRKVLDTLASLGEIYIQKADYDQARACADRQLQTDPLREGAYRQLMEIHSKAGNRAEALRTYQRCLRILDIELGTRPSRETTALFEIISGEDLQPTMPREGAIRGYQIREHLGSGHAGVVYRAFQPVINRDVAIKVILPQFANHPDFIRRFEVEAQLIARLEHPHIVPLYDYWRDPSGAYLVMRWLRGGSLQADLTRGPWKPIPAVKLIDQVTAALSLAHKQGVVHCDIKPANILLDEDDNAYLSDFSIAILTGPLAQLSQLSGGVDESSTGSLGYISPEVSRGLETTPLADIYSLGVVLYEILTGVHPFPGLEGDALVARHLSDPLPSVLNLRPDLPPDVDTVIQKATQKDSSQRYQEAVSLADAFRGALAPETITLVPKPEIPLELRNPYKGLRPFQEADASDFFGRDELVGRIVDRLAGTDPVTKSANRFLAVVGPSGSGKSSVVKAGLIPAIRAGAIPGSERWFIAEMTPGAHPLSELETALLRIAIETPTDLLKGLRSDPNTLVQVLRNAFPGVKDEILLLIDQFEELFTLVDDLEERDHFLDTLVAAVSDPDTPLRVVITLRGDFYDRPLQHSTFGELVQKGTEVVLPLSPAELERAICGPAERVGVTLEGALVARIVQEVGDQPGALPLLQYALTELFEHSEGVTLTLEAYEAGGGVLGALGRRAEAIYSDLEKSKQPAARQLFLRLITLGEGTEDVRRRTLRSELMALSELEDSLANLLDVFGRHRLLTFDHDPATRGPTVEVAHEALLREWQRLGIWLDESRDDIRLQRLLAAASQEWLESGRDPGFLLRGTRLEQFSEWAAITQVALTSDEGDYLDTSLDARREREQAEAERQSRETALEVRSRRFLRWLVGVFALAAVIAVVLSIVAFNQQNVAQNNAATATVAQGEALILADSRATQQALAEAEAEARATQQAIAEAETEARAIAEAQALEDRDRAVEAEQDALQQASIGLASQALAQMSTTNSERGVLLALAALEEYPYTPQAEAALARSVQESLPYRRMFDEKGHNLDQHWVNWSPDGKRIALGAPTNDEGEHSAVVFDFESGEIDLVLPLVLPVEETETSSRCSVQQINWSPDGTKLALAANNNILESAQHHCYYLQIYDSSSGELLLDLDSQGEFAVDWSPDGKRLLTGGENGAVKIWDAHTGEVTLEMAGHVKNSGGIFPRQSDRVFAARFSPDGTQAATFSTGGVVHIWDPTNGDLLLTLEHPQAYLSANWDYGGLYEIALAWSPDGSRLVTAWHDGLARIWNLEHREVSQLLAGHTNNVNGVDWSPDGVYIFTHGTDGSARLWVAATGQMVINLPASGFGNAAWSKNGDWIAVPLQVGLLAWDTSTLPPVLNPTTPILHRTVDGEWTPDGNLFVLNGIDGLVFDWAGDKTSRQIAPTEGYIAISPDSRRMVASEGWNKNPPQIIDLYSGEVITELESPPPEPNGLFFTSSWSNDGRMVASGTFPGFWTVIWDPETGEELARSETIEGFMIMADFSPDDTILAAPSIFTEGNTPVYLIDTQTGETLQELPSEEGWSMISKWSPDGKTLAVGYQDGTIKLWNTDTWTISRIFDAHQIACWDLDWSPDGQRIVSGDDNVIIYIWEVETGNIVSSWDMKGVLGTFQGVGWSPDGQFIVIQGMGTNMPIFRRVWQSTEALIDYAYECCVWRELTPGERELFGLPVKP
jgi:WD40 repeat protein/serine/threonine protein kinase